MCVQLSIQTFKYLCFICTPLNLCWAVFNCVLMWLPVGIYGISRVCQLSQQVHPISQIHSCESKGELCINVASCGNLWDIKHMSTFTTSPSHIPNYTVVSLRENCVLMWLPVGIYGISSICQLSKQVHPISQIHSCESKGELCTNVASCGNLWDIKHMSTFTTSPSHISNTQL